jgi:enterochelin esterase-like enzyme
VNRDVGYFPRLGDALGVTAPTPLMLGGTTTTAVPLGSWRPPAGMPKAGVIGSVRIPATRSHFLARNAYVYLPPAARTPHPPHLPVVIAFSGQPGGPTDVVNAGSLQATVDAIARAHGGLAPIVVVPDQLGPAEHNTMCVDSVRGNVATYITSDVRTWILKHLPVSHDRRQWTVAGFSQGGTCAVQFGAGNPSVFGSFVDVSGQIAPVSGSVAATVRSGFGGSVGAYERAKPANIMAARRPYPATRALFAVGASDKHYRPVALSLSRAARAAGMRTVVRLLPNGAHNWHVAAAGLAWGFHSLLPWWGIR